MVRFSRRLQKDHAKDGTTIPGYDLFNWVQSGLHAYNDKGVESSTGRRKGGSTALGRGASSTAQGRENETAARPR